MQIARFLTLIFAAASLAAAELLPLTDVPWSDLEYRNADFKSESRSNTVALAPPGSLVYNLDGAAESFRCRVGISAEGDLADAVRFEWLLDRKLAGSITVKPGEPFQKIEIPLTGVMQLELSVQYGPEFRKTMLEIVDGVFQTDAPAHLRAVTSEWRERIENERNARPVYPPPPASWKRIRVETFRHGIFEHGYRIGNGKIEIDLLPEFGGRIIGFRRKGGTNVLLPPPLLMERPDLRRGRTFYLQHSHSIRPEPLWYFLPGDDLLLFGAYELTFGAEGEIRMRSARSLYFFLTQEFELRLRPDSDSFEIIQRMKNIGKFPRPCGVWSTTVLPADSVAELEFPGKATLAPPSVRPLEMRAASNGSAILRARLNSGETFEKTVSSPHIYWAQSFLELEGHSPVVTLAPGAAVELREIWRLKPSPASP